MKFNSFFNLPGEWFQGIAVGRVEPTVVAVGAAAVSYGPVAVRTGEPGIHRHFLNPAAKLFFNVFGIRVEPAGVVPGIGFRFQHPMKN
jgi:hypothetical protein